MNHTIRFCEFVGDDEHDWDEVGYKKRCEYAGFEHCTLHRQPLGEHEGWRVCCDACVTPVQIKEQPNDQ